MSPVGAYGKTRIPAVPRTLGERLRKIRLAWNWSQTDMATTLGTNQRTYSAWERDLQLPSQASMMALCRFLRMPTSALLEGKAFGVPEVPLRFSPGPGGTDRPGTPVLVPDLDPDIPAMLLPMDSAESAGPLSSRQALGALKQALAEGRSIWIVVGPRN
ncbi:helix-turn-helix domain-containing protein [Geothrix paludis]|uniref:helix-turn-helix domain-containing protein n=1 Tax=Geothrix paludis TaxID=2922722 RepID=UPI003C2FA2E5